MKKICAFLLCFICILNICTITVYADEEQLYYINNAIFDVYLKENGDAEITETWYVDYVSGSFTRFYKNIYIDLPKEENYSEITNFKAYVDGISCNFTNDVNNRPDQHFNVSQSGDTITYSIYKKSNNVNREFKIEYTLKDVVKYIEKDNTYFFAYRFLPKGYQKNIDTLSINIHPTHPNDDLKIELISSPGSANSYENTLEITDYNAKDLFKVRVKMQGNYFKNISPNSYISNIDVATPLSKTITNFTFYLFGMILCFVMLIFNCIKLKKEERDFSTVSLVIIAFIPIINFFSIFLVFSNISKNVKIKTKIQENPNYLNTLIKGWIQQGINPLDLVAKTAKNKTLVFLMYLSTMIDSGIIQISKDCSQLAYPVNIPEKSTIQVKTIFTILEKIRLFHEARNISANMNGNMWIIPFTFVEEYLKNFDAHVDFVKDINSIISNYPTKIQTKMTTEATDLIRAKKFLPKTQITFLDFLNRYKIDKMSGNIYNLIYFTSQEDLNNVSLNQLDLSQIAIYQYLLFAEACKHKHINPATGFSSSSSSSSCSSCSSCGGCSGCGGCGGSD